MRLFILLLLSIQLHASEDFLSSCRTKEFGSYFQVNCQLEKGHKKYDINFVISQYRMVRADQAKRFCESHFLSLDTAFLYLSMEQMIYFSEDLMNHLDGVNILDRGRTHLTWAAHGGFYRADYDRKGEVDHFQGDDQKLFAICSDTPPGIFLDMKI